MTANRRRGVVFVSMVLAGGLCCAQAAGDREAGAVAPANRWSLQGDGPAAVACGR